MEALVRDTKFQDAETRSQVLQVWKNDVQGLVGSSSRESTKAMAEFTKKPLKLAHVGFFAITEELGDQQKYPAFLRVNPIISELTQGIIGLMKRTCSHALCCFASVTSLE